MLQSIQGSALRLLQRNENIGGVHSDRPEHIKSEETRWSKNPSDDDEYKVQLAQRTHANNARKLQQDDEYYKNLALYKHAHKARKFLRNQVLKFRNRENRCNEPKVKYNATLIVRRTDITSWRPCALLCLDHNCDYWTLFKDDKGKGKTCSIMRNGNNGNGSGMQTNKPNYISGRKNCECDDGGQCSEGLTCKKNYCKYIDDDGVEHSPAPPS